MKSFGLRFFPHAALGSVLLLLAACSSPAQQEQSPPDPSDANASTLRHERWPYRLNANEYHLFAAPHDRSGRIEIVAGQQPIQYWTWTGQGPWRAHPPLAEGYRIEKISPGSFLALRPRQATRCSLGFLPKPQLRITRVFDRIEDGMTIAAPGFFAGSQALILVGSLDLAEGEAWPVTEPASQATLESRNGRQRHSFPLERLSQPGVEPARRLFQATLPKSLEPGFYDLTVSVHGWRSARVAFEVSTPAQAKIRQRLASLANQALQEAGYPDLALVGPHRPLPSGSTVCSAFEEGPSRFIDNDRAWLFYAFEPAEGFAQNASPWIMANEATEEVEVIEADAWPRLLIATDAPDSGPDITCRGSAFGPDFGYKDTRENQIFSAGGEDEGADLPEADDGGEGDSAPEQDDPDTERVPLPGWYQPIPPQGPPSPHRGRGLTGVIDQPCPNGVAKIALLIAFDDNTSETTEDGKPIPNFDHLMEAERRLARELGCDGIASLGPDDFLTPDDYGTTGLPNGNTSTSRLLARIKFLITELVRGIEDPCCTELLIFFNAHQSNSRVKYRNRDVPFRKDGQPVLDDDGNPKTKDLVRGSLEVSQLAENIAEAIREASPDNRCPASQFILHSCYSGRIAGIRLTRALRNGLGVIATSGSRETTKGEREGDITEYHFLEALRTCIQRHPDKTLQDAELWNCIADETSRRSGGTQAPERHEPLF